MRIALVAALASNRVIGRDGALPWRLPADLQRFRALTTGHAVIMGRATHASIGRPLPHRVNVVLSRDPAFAAPGCRVARTMDEALALAAALAPGKDEIFVIGGAEVYAEILPRAERLYLTYVHAEVDGDARFPVLRDDDWYEVESDPHDADAEHAHPFTFVTLSRGR